MLTSIPFFVVASSLLAPTTPQTVLRGALDHYKALKSFSMTIKHKDGSGLFPGAFTQSLKWRKGDAFELVVVKMSGPKPAPDQQGLQAPAFYCGDGATVTIIWRDRPRERRELSHDSNTSPGWEVSGGLILSVLLGSPGADMMFNTPPGVSAKWSFGKATKWQGEAVREIQVAWDIQGRSGAMSVYVSANGRRLVGFSAAGGGSKPGWAHYMNQVENPTLPRSLGTAPK